MTIQKTILAILALIVILALGCRLLLNRSEHEGVNANTSQPNNDDPMNTLIERLADAYREPIKLGGEAILYQPKEDKGIRTEIRSKGRIAVPYLIKGLSHKDALLGDIPTREGLSGLINALGLTGACSVPTAPLHRSLHKLTGHDRPIGPKSMTNPDISIMRTIWLPWWEKNKERIVDTEKGIGLSNNNGSISPLPIPEASPPKPLSP